MNETFTAAVQQYKTINWLWLIPLFPFLGATLNGFFGKKLQDRYGKKVPHAIAIGMMTAAAIVAVAAFIELLKLPAHSRFLLDSVFPMIHIGKFHVDMAFAIDPLSGMMALIITLIGTGIHVYSTGYMSEEPSYWRFFCYLNLFVFSMLLLVLGDSFVIMFFGWEGVGLCSYLLIGFWYKEKKNATAGMKAFVVNRVGDWGFVTGLFFLFWGLGGSWSNIDKHYYPDLAEGGMPRYNVAVVDEPAGGEEAKPPAHEEALEHKGVHHESVEVGPTVVFRELRNQLSITAENGARPLADELLKKEVWGIPLVFLIGLCLFIGACGKSAQIPLYVWLPDAMAGPTPVSALIHAATMVTAGVYMIARLNFVFVMSPGAMTVVATVGALTALFAATIGLFQYDIKKVLAYSTVSQLGFMFVGVGVGAYWAGAFHLLTHACFKACLFLGSGSVIHGMHHLTHHREHAAHSGDDHGGEHDEHGAAHGDDEHKPRPQINDPRLAPDPTDPQDMRNMGGLGALMPKTKWTYLIACWAIAGFPWAAGFFSKDEILWKAFTNHSTLVPGWFIWALGLVAATCTSFYMFRSYYMTFEGRAPSAEHKEHVHESPPSITGVLIALAAACLIIGPLLGFPSAISHREPLLAQWLEPVTNLTGAYLTGARAFADNHALEFAFMALSIGVATLGWFGARALYKDIAATEARLASLRVQYANIHKLVFEKYRIDELYDATFVRAFTKGADAMAWIDANIVDGLVNLMGTLSMGAAWISGAIDKYLVDGAVNAVADLTLDAGRRIRHVQTGRINNYVLGVVVGVIILVVITSLV
ncbi:MAG TPA: proton-conducting transporter membrane subunit [Polyangia bacterium]|nr:proton-conducting transporter membrane subunit [Polyangia bacterium]